MTIYHHSLEIDRFDPLPVFEHFARTSPGLLESMNARPKTGQFSIVALRSTESYRLERSRGLIHTSSQGQRCIEGDPFDALAQRLAEYSSTQSCPSPFPGGFFGVLSYDLAAWVEELPQRLDTLRDIPVPDLHLDWVDRTACYDHLNRRLHLCSLKSREDLEQLVEEITPLLGVVDTALPPSKLSAPCLPVMAQERFESMVVRAKEYIASGDIYQTNLSCRFDGQYEGSSEELYRRLRHVNPSPFACLIRLPELDIVSSSPERLVSLRQGIAETRPIAGTRRRGLDEQEDLDLHRELISHPKERAEHIMLLDLERNDLGRVCKAGSVQVDELMVLEHYSHVTHIVSNVRGELRIDLGPFDLIRASFPGGTITGAPKKRCMEIIEELEPTGRGTYTGSAGYISVTGEMDLNILIRSFQKIGNRINYQVGAGIVADSIPEKEWAECLAKGAALQKALEMEL